MHRFFTFFLLLTAIASSTASGSRPVSTGFMEERTTTKGEVYRVYMVNCSNGSQVAITKWDDDRRWCVGEESRELCERGKVEAAKAACEIE